MIRSSAFSVATGMTAGAALALASSAHAQSQATPTDKTNDIVVQAKQPVSQTLIDRTVYDISSDLQKATGSAADILNQLPSVDVDADGGVSLRGDPSVTILVDGKPSAQFSGPAKGSNLQQFPARDIERVEVMTNPPAQYKAEGSGGVINIITKKKLRNGLSGSVQANAGLEGRALLAGNLAYNRGKLKLSGNLALRRDTRERQINDDSIAIDPLTTSRTFNRETLEEHLRRITPSGKFAADYQIDDKRSFGGSVNFSELMGHRDGDERNESGPSPDLFTASSDRLSIGHETNVDAGGELHYSQKFNRPGETLDLSLQRSSSLQRERYDYVDFDPGPGGGTSLDQLRLRSILTTTEFSADYDLPIAKRSDLKLGYDFERDDTSSDSAAAEVDPVTGALIPNPSITSQFRARQDVNAAYAQFQTPVGKWTLQAGLRVEATDVRTRSPLTMTSGGQNYVGAYPSVHFQRGLSDHQTLNLSVSRRISRPQPDSLNPFIAARDVHYLRAGNPNLRPQDTWAYQIAYENNAKPIAWSVTGYLRLIRDSVTSVSHQVGDDVLLTTLVNLPRTVSVGVEATANGKIGRTLSYNLSVNVFHTRIEVGGLNVGDGLRSMTGVSGKASIDWKPTASDTMQVSFSRTDRRLIPQGVIGGYESVNLGYSRKLSPALSLVGTVTDLFDTRGSRRQLSSPFLVDDYRLHQIGRVSFLGVVYTFGNGRKKAERFDYDPG